MSAACREPLFSSSDRTMASKVRDATRKNKSLMPSPGTLMRQRERSWGIQGLSGGGGARMDLRDWLSPDCADTAQYSALISSDSLMASCSMRSKWSGDWAEEYTEVSVGRCQTTEISKKSPYHKFHPHWGPSWYQQGRVKHWMGHFPSWRLPTTAYTHLDISVEQLV